MVALSSRIRVALALLLAVIASSLMSAAPAASTPDPQISLPQTLIPQTLDDRFALVGTEVPQFGGTYVDEEAGEQVIWLTNPSQALAFAAQRALVAVLGKASVGSLVPVARQARYTFSQLKAWEDESSLEILALPGVVSTDIDEMINRLRVGVESISLHRDPVESTLRSLGVPLDSLVIDEVEPIRFESSLQGKHRPILGGLQIQSGEGTCTLGFNAKRSGVQGFVTNSHCTLTQGGVEGTTFGQPLLANVVGTETVDPTYYTGEDCPAGRRCRYSDAAFVRNAVGITFDQGRVAAAALNGPTWNGTSKYRITSETNPLANQSVMKIGRTTGRTVGTVTQTCVKLNVANTNITMTCQATASYSSSGGDSGSPIVSNTSSDVSLKGIHWGSNGAFSSIGNIQLAIELGSLQTCASGFTC
jgi:hypothetical protein